MIRVFIILLLYFNGIVFAQKNLISIGYSTQIQVKQIVDGNFVDWSTANISWLDWEKNNLFRYLDLQRNSFYATSHIHLKEKTFLYLGAGYGKETFCFQNAYADTSITASGKTWSPEFMSYGIKYVDFRFGISLKKFLNKGFLLWNINFNGLFLLEQFADYRWPIDVHNFPNKFGPMMIQTNLDWFIKLKSNHFLKPFIGLRFPAAHLNKNISRENVTAFTLNLGIGYTFGWDKKNIE